MNTLHLITCLNPGSRNTKCIVPIIDIILVGYTSDPARPIRECTDSIGVLFNNWTIIIHVSSNGFCLVTPVVKITRQLTVGINSPIATHSTHLNVLQRDIGSQSRAEVYSIHYVPIYHTWLVNNITTGIPSELNVMSIASSGHFVPARPFQ